MAIEQSDPTWKNLGSRRIPKLRPADFPNADDIVRDGLLKSGRSKEAVDIMLVNPPPPMAGCGSGPSTVLAAAREIWSGRRYPWPRWPR